MSTEMNFTEYQIEAWKTRAWPDTPDGNLYPVLALAEEAGEVCGKVAKALRKGVPVDRNALALELGDVLWQLSAVATTYDLNLAEVAENNLTKLADRVARSTLIGEGDNR